MLHWMSMPETSPPPAPAPRRSWKQAAIKTCSIITIAVGLGLGYDWAAPRFYGTDRVAGFKLGMLHGAFMPAALLTLLRGNDVPIYAPNNVGRLYKLGYISGINICGLLFFGFAFRRPRDR